MKRERMTCKEWKRLGKKLYGTDKRKWKFKCVSCGNIQSLEDFDGIPDIEPEKYVYFSCLGRFKEEIGCDWTLGGLFQIHKLEVQGKDGKYYPAFEFADQINNEENEETEGFKKKMNKEEAIQIIESLFPADAELKETAEMGKKLFLQAKLETEDWRTESEEILVRYAELCEYHDHKFNKDFF